eukprot:6464254-Amphidinium_carterae.1
MSMCIRLRASNSFALPWHGILALYVAIVVAGLHLKLLLDSSSHWAESLTSAPFDERYNWNKDAFPCSIGHTSDCWQTAESLDYPAVEDETGHVEGVPLYNDMSSANGTYGNSEQCPQYLGFNVAPVEHSQTTSPQTHGQWTLLSYEHATDQISYQAIWEWDRAHAIPQPPLGSMSTCDTTWNGRRTGLPTRHCVGAEYFSQGTHIQLQLPNLGALAPYILVQSMDGKVTQLCAHHAEAASGHCVENLYNSTLEDQVTQLLWHPLRSHLVGTSYALSIRPANFTGQRDFDPPGEVEPDIRLA